MCKKFEEKVRMYSFEVRDGKVFYTLNGKEKAITKKSDLTDEIMFAFVIMYKRDKNVFLKFKEKYNEYKVDKIVGTQKEVVEIDGKKVERNKITEGTNIQLLRKWFIDTELNKGIITEFDYLIKKVKYESTRTSINDFDFDSFDFGSDEEIEGNE